MQKFHNIQQEVFEIKFILYIKQKQNRKQNYRNTYPIMREMPILELFRTNLFWDDFTSIFLCNLLQI